SVINSMTQLSGQRPQLVPAFLLLADAHRALGHFDEVVAVYRRLAELVPDDPQFPLQTGLIYLQQNKKGEARKALEKALDIAPDYIPGIEQLVELDLADKQYDTALQRVQKNVGKYPNAPELQ